MFEEKRGCNENCKSMEGFVVFGDGLVSRFGKVDAKNVRGLDGLYRRESVNTGGTRRCVITSAMSEVSEAVRMQQLIEVIGGPMILPTLNDLGAAIAGGTVGCMITLITLEWSKQRSVERKQCEYCRGTGRLPCGSCYGLSVHPDEVLGETDCVNCSARGFCECNHCDGSGRLLPIRYERALRQQYEEYYFGAFDDDYYNSDRTYQ
mmetsp:Transcript_1159/g.2166  ORF Transcript_1159/g.2166 Transcript_1159/m.2166 type:complete len:206 (+) Transcript_1159:51-668(+)